MSAPVPVQDGFLARVPAPAATLTLGSVYATSGAVETAPRPVLASLLNRHGSGDWGDLDADDQQANVDAIRDGERVLSAYHVGETKLYVITEWDRSSTTIMLAEEY